VTFILAKEPRWTWPVKVRVPVDGGRHEEQVFEATFRLIDDANREALFADRDAVAGSRAFLEAAIVGWSGVTDEKGTPIPFAPSTLAQLVRIPFVLAALSEAYAEGIAGAARRN